MGNKKLSKRRRNRKHETSKASILKRPSGRARKPLEDEYAMLNAKIGVLEEFITGSVIHQERLRRQAREGILPPPDHPSFKKNRNGRRRMILSEQEAYYQHRQQHGLTFLALFIAACAIAWWLLGSGGFQ